MSSGDGGGIGDILRNDGYPYTRKGKEGPEGLSRKPSELRLNIVNTCSSSYLYFEFATIACAEPAAIEETLWFNIFPVTELPDFISMLLTLTIAKLETFTMKLIASC